ncbi:MAG: MFS transporter [Hyphomicrobiales bacterium]|nr:MFS transporter [Hyphomicrobiales bacterium]MBV9520062.1 MFS transporter [Hyphomicrobiales bacterium]
MKVGEQSVEGRAQIAAVPRWKRARYAVLLSLSLMYFIAYIDRTNISVAGPFISRELALSKGQLGFIFSVFAYPYTAMQIIGGWLADRFGPRLILFLLCVIWSVGTVLTGMVGGAVSLIVVRLLVGIGEGGAFPAATRAMSFWFPPQERGLAQGVTHSFARLGGAAAPYAVVGIMAAFGWRAAFFVLGALSAAWAAWWLISFRNTPHENPSVAPDELEEIGIPATKTALEKTPWRAMISRMWLVTFVDFCYGWSLWVFLTWLPSYLLEARGFDVTKMALFTSLPLAAGVLGDSLGGIISDRILKATGNLRLARCSLLVFGLTGALGFMVPAVRTEDAYLAVYGLTASFFCLELTNAVLWSLPIDIAGRYAGTAGGMMNTGFGLAGAISPVVFGILIQRTGSYVGPFAITAGLLAVGVVGALFIDPNRKVEEQSFAAITS